MVMTFDYETAWKGLAEPGFNALPQNVRDLYEQVCVESDALEQDRITLDMPWPKTDLRVRFEELPAEELARASLIVDVYGHWSSEEHSYKGHGGTWKFSHYADQVLRERLGISRKLPRGLSYDVHRGVLCIRLSTHDEGARSEVALATPTAFEVVKKEVDARLAPLPLTTRNAVQVCADTLYTLAEELRTRLWPTGGVIAGFYPGRARAKYMATEEEMAQRRRRRRLEKETKAVDSGTCLKCGGQDIVRVTDVREVYDQLGELRSRETRGSWYECPACGTEMRLEEV